MIIISYRVKKWCVECREGEKVKRREHIKTTTEQMMRDAERVQQ
jgi:hypothetical protein